MVSNRITILGAGESGTGAALLAKAKGFDVFVSDAGSIKQSYKADLKGNDVPFEESRHTEELVLNAGLIIKSPGIPEKAPIVQSALKCGIEVIDEIEFATRYTDAQIIAITGTNGKTTTTLLTYHLLKEAGLRVGVAGNVGQSFAKQVIEDKNDFYVLELSSFQLDGIVNFKPDIGVLLNITPDHMDRYDYSLSRYADSKFQLIKNMGKDDHFIYFSDNDLIKEGVEKRNFKGQGHPVSLKDKNRIYLEEGVMHFNNGLTIDQEGTALKGVHNAINMMSAVAVALILDVGDEVIQNGLESFRNAPHRMEYVATINKVDFINDSKATNVDAVQYALNSFREPLVWIAGGVDKGNDYDLIMESVNAKVKALVCLGTDNSKLRDAFHQQIINLLETDNIMDAVRSAMNYAEEHDVVLLSPACASFDLFENYEDRGNQFKQAVLELKREFENKALKQ